MSSSHCPNCKKFIIPNAEKCTKCGFNTKKYREEHYYIPEKEFSRLNAPDQSSGLHIIQKIRIFLFPPVLFWYLLISNPNQKQIMQASIIAIFGLTFDILLWFLFPTEINQLIDSLRSTGFSEIGI